MKIRPVILSGGSGTRLWPVSRRALPKPFVPLFGDKSLFEVALELVKDDSLFLPPMIVGNVEHQFLILDALAKTGTMKPVILLEPEGRNTAAAAISAALAEDNDNVLHLILPSDHVITDAETYRDAVRTAMPAACDNHIVLLGIKPLQAETGYGYITYEIETKWPHVYNIENFTEKPSADVAEALIRSGALWNAGVFLYLPQVLIEETAHLAPECLALCQKALAGAHKSGFHSVLAAEPYTQLDDRSFDRAIMEHTRLGCVVPCAFGWSDAGSWQSLWQIEKHDDHGNSFQGPIISHDVSDAYIRSDGPIVAVLGLHDIAVIAMRDAVLIAPRERSQDVKALVAEVERQSPAITSNGIRVVRPWGTYESLAQDDCFQVKHIIVQPGRMLSLQQHFHRAEHWVVVEGTAKAESNGVEQLIFPNESFYVPRGAKHRLSNPGRIPLHLIEVQSGDYLGEDDIVRFDDLYGRAAHNEAKH